MEEYQQALRDAETTKQSLDRLAGKIDQLLDEVWDSEEEPNRENITLRLKALKTEQRQLEADLATLWESYRRKYAEFLREGADRPTQGA